MTRTNYESVFILLIFIFLSISACSQDIKITKYKFTPEDHELWRIENAGFFQPPIKYTSYKTPVTDVIDSYKLGLSKKDVLANYTGLSIPRKSQYDKLKSDTSTAVSSLDKISNFMEWYMTYFPVPFSSYSDETNWLIGLSKYNAFKLKKNDKTDTITQPSVITAFTYYTLNKQLKFALEANLMFNKNRSIWRTNFYYIDYPLNFYGVGNETSLTDRRSLVTTNIQFGTYYLWKVIEKWYFGPSYDYYNYFDVELSDGYPSFPSDSINFAHNIGKQSGLGLKLQREGRDNRLNAKSGYYVEAGFQVYRQIFGSEYEFNSLLLDFRYYTTPWKFLTIASQIRMEAKTGDVPIQSLALLGGDYHMRGTYWGRYRDKVLLDSQVELRFPIYWIFGGVLFNSIGQVAPGYEDLAFRRFHYNYGAGLRLQVDSQNDINLRFDYGISSDQSYFIINFSEAF